MAKSIGIDLGTTNTNICQKGKGIVLREPTAVAFDSGSGDIIAAGTRAKKMLGKNPPEIEVVLPIKGGAISDFEDAAEMLITFLYKLGLRGITAKPRITVAVPWGITEVEKNAFENVCVEASGRDVCLLVEEPMAAAIGAGIDVMKARGGLICDTGGGNTQTAIISYRGVIKADMIRTGGDDIDEAIISYVRNNYSIALGKSKAELIKKQIGSAHPAFDRGEFSVYGRNLITGQVVKIAISSSEVREAILPVLESITEHIRSVLEGIPPELASDVFDAGLTLTGGTALLPGIDRLINERLGLPVRITKHPTDSVCRGLMVLQDASDDMLQAVCVKEDRDR